MFGRVITKADKKERIEDRHAVAPVRCRLSVQGWCQQFAKSADTSAEEVVWLYRRVHYRIVGTGALSNGVAGDLRRLPELITVDVPGCIATGEGFGVAGGPWWYHNLRRAGYARQRRRRCSGFTTCRDRPTAVEVRYGGALVLTDRGWMRQTITPSLFMMALTRSSGGISFN